MRGMLRCLVLGSWFSVLVRMAIISMGRWQSRHVAESSLPSIALVVAKLVSGVLIRVAVVAGHGLRVRVAIATVVPGSGLRCHVNDTLSGRTRASVGHDVPDPELLIRIVGARYAD